MCVGGGNLFLVVPPSDASGYFPPGNPVPPSPMLQVQKPRRMPWIKAM